MWTNLMRTSKRIIKDKVNWAKKEKEQKRLDEFEERKMTVQEYIDRMGNFEIKDSDTIVYSDPKRNMIGGKTKKGRMF